MLHPIGWDSFGLPAENAAIKRDAHPAEWTYTNIETQAKSFKRYGLSLDWSRRLHTSDPDYYRDSVEPLLGEDTVYRGHLDHRQLPDLLASGEVYLASPLWAEPFGLATVEAMAMGTPVAAFLTGALGEIVGPRAGDLAIHHSAEALADSVQVARTRDRRGVHCWSRRFSADRMVASYLGFLHEVAERAGTLPAHGPVGAPYGDQLTVQVRDSIDAPPAGPDDDGSPTLQSVRTVQ